MYDKYCVAVRSIPFWCVRNPLGDPYGGPVQPKQNSLATAKMFAKTCKSAVFLMVACAALSACAGTWWVDAQSTAEGETGTSEQPYRTIQAAVDAAAANDTVYVRPGVYDRGGRIDPGMDGGKGCTNRVVIAKRLRIESTDGAAVTHIVGQYATPNGRQAGATAVSCVSCTADGTVLKGFTLRDGASADTGANLNINHAGGIRSSRQNVFVVDCVVSNCVATRGGAMRNGIAIRTLFVGNRTTGGYGSALRGSRAYACVFLGNGASSSDNHLAAVDASDWLSCCTFVGQPCGGAIAGGNIALNLDNCLFAFSRLESLTFLADHATHVRSCVADTVRTDASATVTLDRFTTGVSPYQVASPFEGDFRVVAYGPCDGTGDPSLTSPAWVPEEFRGYDINGRPLLKSDGSCNIGACAESVSPKGGFLTFGAKGSLPPVLADGSVLHRNTAYASADNRIYIGAVDRHPRQVCVVAAPNLQDASLPPLALERTGAGLTDDGNTPWAFFDSGANRDRTWLMVPPLGHVSTNTVTYAASVRYVSPDGTDDAAAGRGESEASPYRTLQYAVDRSASSSILIALPGVYDEGHGYANGMSNRVCFVKKHFVLRSRDGASVTTILGRNEPNFSILNMRPIAMEGSGYHVLVQGFTLSGGNVRENKNASQGCGPAGAGYNHRSQVRDCLVTGNGRSWCRGGAFNSIWAARCVFTNNYTLGQAGANRNGICSSCVMYENYAGGGGDIDVSGFGVQCSSYSLQMQGASMPLAAASADFYNCVCAGTVAAPAEGYERAGCYCLGTGGTGYAACSHQFVDPSAMDFRLRSDSEAVTGLGVNVSPKNPGWLWLYSTDDIEGNPLVYIDGRPIPGAVQKIVPVVKLAATQSAELTVSPAPDADGCIVLTNADQRITLTAAATSRRNRLGPYEVNGVRVGSIAEPYSFGLDDLVSVTGPVTVGVAINPHWYVAPGGNDANDGWTAGTPRRTLTAGVADAVSGDTVHLAAGTYADGVAYLTSGSGTFNQTGNRVIVPEGVTLVGDEGAEATLIVGAFGSNNKVGTGAVRCAFLERNACIRRCTLTGGSVYGGGASDTDDYAGGFNARDMTGYAEYCIISNNHGMRASAAASGSCVRCRLLKNTAAAWGTGVAGRNASFYGCWFDGNSNGTLVMDPPCFVGCTVSANNDFGDYSTFAVQSSSAGAVIANNVILSGDISVSGAMSNSIAAAGLTVTAGGGLSNVTTDYTAAELKLDAAGVPAKDSPAVDYGTVSTTYDALWGAETDLYGVARVYNGAQDCGACERDWRADYAQDMGVGFAVQAADACVREVSSVAGRRVYLPAGTLVASRISGNGRVRGTLEVTGTGVLEVAVNGIVRARCRQGQTKIRLAAESEADRLTFTYLPGADDAGGAYLSNLTCGTGLAVFVR